jgi:hypothetical protein
VDSTCVSKPADAEEGIDPPLQCAWCRRFYDRHGLIDGLEARYLKGGYSHGMCHRCLDETYRHLVSRCQAAGELAAALETERERLRCLSQLARERGIERQQRFSLWHERGQRRLAASRAVLRRLAERVYINSRSSRSGLGTGSI